LEARALPASGRVDSMGDSDGCCCNDNAGSDCPSATSERKGELSVSVLSAFYVLLMHFDLFFFLQREDEMERRRISHHINFDAL
jgi:hypothetical protein